MISRPKILSALGHRVGLGDHRTLKPRSMATVLLGDDGYRVATLDNKRRLSSFWAPSGDDGRASVLAWLRGQKIKTVRLVCDQTGQSYAREELPKVGRRDREALLKRRLTSRFGENALAAVVEVPATPAPGEAPTTQPFLLAGLPQEKPVEPWLDELAANGIETESISLLPLEWANNLSLMFGSAEQSFTVDDKSPNIWRIVVTHHRTGGIRHIVMSGNHLVLTRMTGVPVGMGEELLSSTPVDETPAKADPPPMIGMGVQAEANSTSPVGGVSRSRWQVELVSEIEASIGYIKRFGYTSDQKLIVSLVGGDAFKDLIDEIKRSETRPVLEWQAIALADLRTALHIERQTGIGSADADDDRADEWLAAILSARKTSHALSSSEWRRRSKLRQHEQLGRIGVAAAAVAISSWSVWSAIHWQSLRDTETLLHLEIAGLETRLADLDQQLASVPADIQSRYALLSAFDQHYSAAVSPADIHRQIQFALGPDLRLDRLIWREVDAQPESNAAREPQILNDIPWEQVGTQNAAVLSESSSMMQLELDLDLSRAVDAEAAAAIGEAFIQDLRRRLPEGALRVVETVIPREIEQADEGNWSADQAPVETPSMSGRLVLQLPIDTRIDLTTLALGPVDPQDEP